MRLTAAADQDFKDIVEWTVEQFGDQQALVYAETIALALEALAEGPSPPIDAKRRDEIQTGLFSLHVARQGRKGSHFVMFRTASRSRYVIEALRLLHDSMDIPRHLKIPDESS